MFWVCGYGKLYTGIQYTTDTDYDHTKYLRVLYCFKRDQ